MSSARKVAETSLEALAEARLELARENARKALIASAHGKPVTVVVIEYSRLHREGRVGGAAKLAAREDTTSTTPECEPGTS